MAARHILTVAEAVLLAVFKYFVLNGQYNDFSMEWYTNVGLSVLVRRA
jgi:hypothetical protein